MTTTAWTWWTPDDRLFMVYGEDGHIAYAETIPAEVAICDLCNGDILVRPVPVVWGDYALCPDCFAETTGITLEEAARRDGVQLEGEGTC